LRLVDAHAHLEEVEELEQALRRAWEAGVKAIIAVGSDYHSSKFALELAEKPLRPKVYAALGIHPWSLNPSTLDSTMEFIRRNLGKAVAVGEVGLDYWYKETRRDREKQALQRKVFEEFLKMAESNGKPVIIHSRGAWGDSLKMAIELGVEEAVFHWFSGPQEVLENLLSHGYYVSATPAVAYSREHRKAVLSTPLSRLLLETDSPVSYGGKPSEPADILKTLEGVASVKNMSREKIAEETFENTLRFFKLPLD
jgi:TatD DNase family protein